VTTIDEAVAGAKRAAAFAAKRPGPQATNPYPADGTPVERAARRAWFREYLRRRPSAGVVSWQSDIDYLAHGDEHDPPDPADDGSTPAAAPRPGAGIFDM